MILDWIVLLILMAIPAVPAFAGVTLLLWRQQVQIDESYGRCAGDKAIAAIQNRRHFRVLGGC